MGLCLRRGDELGRKESPEFSGPYLVQVCALHGATESGVGGEGSKCGIEVK